MTVASSLKFSLLLTTSLLMAACSSSNPEGSSSVDSVNGGNAGSTYDTTDYSSTGVSGSSLNSESVGVEILEEFQQQVGNQVLFATDRYDLTPEAQQILQRQAEWLKQHPDLRLVIEGHCDERGTREYNLALGERRAVAIKNYLVALGIPANRVRTVSYGKEKPVVVGTGESVWAQNRRGVLVLTR